MFSYFNEPEASFSTNPQVEPYNVDDDPIIIPNMQNSETESSSWILAVPLNTIPPSEPINSETPSTSEKHLVNNVHSEPHHLIADKPIAETSSSVPDPPYSEMGPQLPAQRWTKHHPTEQILGDPNASIQTRHGSGNIWLFVNFISLLEPNKTDDALKDPN